MDLLLDQEGVQVWHGDAAMAPGVVALNGVRCLASDPPWGSDTDTDSTRFSGGNYPRGGRAPGRLQGDRLPFSPLPWMLTLPRVVLWGANHFASTLPQGTWLVWMKKPPERVGAFLSDAELAWEKPLTRKQGRGVYAHYLQWEGACRGSDREWLHPTQKPLQIMRWCLERQGLSPGDLVLDPYCGSGTTLLAAKQLGLRAIGIDVDRRYAECAARRLSQRVLPFEEVVR